VADDVVGLLFLAFRFWEVAEFAVMEMVMNPRKSIFNPSTYDFSGSTT
jgi:hypothetical protein